jgi:integrase
VVLSIQTANQKPMLNAGDITAQGVLQRIRELRRIGPPPTINKPRKKLSPQTCEHYLARAREFAGWLVTRGFLAVNPLHGLQAYSADVISQTKTRQRRALSAQEQADLVTLTDSLPTRWNMAGPERSLLYRMALRTGLRAKELRTLKVANFNFFARSVTVLAADAKARRQDTLPLASDLVQLLKEHFAGKLPEASAFTPLSTARYCRMLRDDLKDLGIEYQDALGRFADFHALRHTYGTDLARVAMPSVHKKLMRHAKIETTEKYYTHVEDQDKAAAIDKLAALPQLPAAGAAG